MLEEIISLLPVNKQHHDAKSGSCFIPLLINPDDIVGELVDQGNMHPRCLRDRCSIS